MGRNQEIQKTRLNADRKFHDTLTQELFETPNRLNIDGLNQSSIIWKAREYHYMHGKGHQDEGIYEKFPGPDLVFFYYSDAFRFLVVEVKGSLLGRSHVDADRQLGRARSYFTKLWKAVIVNQIKPSLLQRFPELPSTDTFLSLTEATRGYLGSEYEVHSYDKDDKDVYLGKVTISSEKRVYFG